MAAKNKIGIIGILVVLLVLLAGGTGCSSKSQGEDEEDSSSIRQEGDKVDDKGSSAEMNEKYGKLIWSDEFDYEGLPDSSKWSYEVGGHGWGNQELQFYTANRVENATVKDGKLVITARKEVSEGSEYTSARLVTKNKGEWLYGRIEVKAKLPKGRGTWPAIWMLPTDSTYGSWPDMGEIDIMEHVGYEPGKVHATIHTGKYNHKAGTQIGKLTQVDAYDTEFHVYAVEWRPYQLAFFVDDEQYFTVEYDYEKDGADGYMAWPFDRPFHLIMNIAVGGSWGGARGVDEAIFPQSMEVDYVRVYDLNYSVEAADRMPPNPPEVVGVTQSGEGYELRWKAPTDDYGVLLYKVYMDGEGVGYSFKNRTLLHGVNEGETHEFQVEAVDYAKHGTVSEKESLKIE